MPQIGQRATKIRYIVTEDTGASGPSYQEVEALYSHT